MSTEQETVCRGDQKAVDQTPETGGETAAEARPPRWPRAPGEAAPPEARRRRGFLRGEAEAPAEASNEGRLQRHLPSQRKRPAGRSRSGAESPSCPRDHRRLRSASPPSSSSMKATSSRHRRLRRPTRRWSTSATSRGLIPPNSPSQQRRPQGDRQVGDRVEALVSTRRTTGPDPLEKRPVRAGLGRIRDRRPGRDRQGTVIEVVKGDLIVDIGLRGFLPASLVDLRGSATWSRSSARNQAKVIELDRNRNNVVLSRRAHLEEGRPSGASPSSTSCRRARSAPAWSPRRRLRRLRRPRRHGPRPRVELSWQHVNHPSEVVNVGDEVTVRSSGGPGAGAHLAVDPGDPGGPVGGVLRQYEVGDIVEARSQDRPVRLSSPSWTASKAWSRVEIAVHRVESPELELSIGQKVGQDHREGRRRRRISLSIKQALPDWEGARSVPGRFERPRPAASSSGVRAQEEERRRASRRLPGPSCRSSRGGIRRRAKGPRPGPSSVLGGGSAWRPLFDVDLVRRRRGALFYAGVTVRNVLVIAAARCAAPGVRPRTERATTLIEN